MSYALVQGVGKATANVDATAFWVREGPSYADFLTDVIPKSIYTPRDFARRAGPKWKPSVFVALDVPMKLRTPAICPLRLTS